MSALIYMGLGAVLMAVLGWLYLIWSWLDGGWGW